MLMGWQTLNMDIREVRRERLRSFIKQFKSTADFAREFELEPSYLSQILTEHRNLGEKAARKLERSIGKPPKWLDIEEQSDLAAGAAYELTHSHPGFVAEERPAYKSREAAKIIRQIQKLDNENRLPAAIAEAILSILKMAPAESISIETATPSAAAGGVKIKNESVSATDQINAAYNLHGLLEKGGELIEKKDKIIGQIRAPKKQAKEKSKPIAPQKTKTSK